MGVNTHGHLLSPGWPINKIPLEAQKVVDGGRSVAMPAGTTIRAWRWYELARNLLRRRRRARDNP